MIDDPLYTNELLARLKECLPFKVMAGKRLVQALRERNIKIKPREKLLVKDVLYLEDTGGIMCAVADRKESKESIVVSLTHVIMASDHPLYPAVKFYQLTRIKRLAASDGAV